MAATARSCRASRRDAARTAFERVTVLRAEEGGWAWVATEPNAPVAPVAPVRYRSPPSNRPGGLTGQDQSVGPGTAGAMPAPGRCDGGATMSDDIGSREDTVSRVARDGSWVARSPR